MVTGDIDRALIGLVIKRGVERSGLTAERFAAESSGFSRVTLWRAMRGWDKTSTATYRHIETALDMPYESLDLVGRHEFDALREEGVDPALVRWIESKASAKRSVPVAEFVTAEDVTPRTSRREQS